MRIFLLSVSSFFLRCGVDISEFIPNFGVPIRYGEGRKRDYLTLMTECVY